MARHIGRSIRSLSALALLLALDSGAASAQSGTSLPPLSPPTGYTVIHSFGAEGSPQGGLLLGIDGNLYGSTCGQPVSGTLYRVDSSRVVHILHSFEPGECPLGALAQSTDGVLFGTTYVAGPKGGGTVYRFDPSDASSFRVLHPFDGADGSNPTGLTLGIDGYLYGVTLHGGLFGSGTFFRIGQQDDSQFAVLKDFGGEYQGGHAPGSLNSAGLSPYGRLVQGPGGDFYGTTLEGPVQYDANGSGNSLGGTIFRITPTGQIVWWQDLRKRDAQNAASVYGDQPYGGLVDTGDGIFYGTTWRGGAYGGGTVFRIDAAGNAPQFLHDFQFDDPNGYAPKAELFEAGDGNLYGTTELNASIFRVALQDGQVSPVHRLTSSIFGDEGSSILAPVTEGADGVLYGTASRGGDFGGGVVFALTEAAATSISVSSVRAAYGGVTDVFATLTSNGQPIGSRLVTFTLNGAPIGSRSTGADGVAAVIGISLAGIDAGTYIGAIGASFAGDSTYAASAASADLTIDPAATAVSLSASPNPSDSGAVVQFTATVSPTGTGGSVTFSDGTTAIGTSPVDATGVATLALTSLAAGTHTIAASFDGTSNYRASVSEPITQLVNPAPTLVPTVVLWTPPTHLAYASEWTQVLNSARLFVARTPLDFNNPLSSTCVYTPLIGTLFEAGTHRISVSCTPADPRYAPAVAERTLVVTKVLPAPMVRANSAFWSFSTFTAGVVVDPTLRRLYAADGNNTVTVIDTSTGIAVASLSVGRQILPRPILDPGSGVVYLPGANALITIDGKTATANSISLGFMPSAIAGDWSGGRLFVGTGNDAGGTVTVIDTASRLVSRSFDVPFAPTAMEFNPANGLLYISGGVRPVVIAVDSASGTVVASIDVEAFPAWLAVNAAKNRLYVSNFQGNSVSVIDGATNTSIATIPTPPAPVAVAVNENTGRVYVTSFSGRLSIIDGDADAVLDEVFAGPAPYGIAIDPLGNQIYVGDQSSTNVLVITDTASTLKWSVPASITYGSALSPSELNASASVPGMFEYVPSIGSVLHAGNHTLRVSFTPADSTNYLTASATRTIAVTPAALQITANDASKVYGAPLPPFGVTATGFVNGDSLGSLTGTLAFDTSATTTSPVGTYTVTPRGVASADYDIAFTAGTLKIEPAGTTTTVTSSANPASAGQAITFTARIAAVGPGAGLPSGNVQFTDGTTVLGTIALSNGVASVTAPLLPGTHVVTARYSGDANFLAASGSINETVNGPAQSTSTALTQSTTVAVNTPIALTAVVSVVSAASTTAPRGTVTFYDGATSLGPAAPLALVKGKNQATLTVTFAGIGPHTLTAIYSGDAVFAGSTSAPFTETVFRSGSTPSATTTTVAAPIAAIAGSPFSVTGRVTARNKQTPVGSVSIVVDGVSVGTALLDAVGNYTFTVAGVAPGGHAIVAMYLGDANAVFAGSTSTTAVTFAQ